MNAGGDSDMHPAEEFFPEEEEEDLLEAPSDQQPNRKRTGYFCKYSSNYLVVFMFFLFLNIFLYLISLSMTFTTEQTDKSKSRTSILPPEVYRQKTFLFHPIFASEPNEKTERAWEALIPGTS